MLADAKTDRVLGVHIIGARAGDLIAEVTAAMSSVPAVKTLPAFATHTATLSEIVHEAALAIGGRANHTA